MTTDVKVLVVLPFGEYWPEDLPVQCLEVDLNNIFEAVRVHHPDFVLVANSVSFFPNAETLAYGFSKREPSCKVEVVEIGCDLDNYLQPPRVVRLELQLPKTARVALLPPAPNRLALPPAFEP